ncbi:MAG TPA: tetraacyldisaccharide 4'-kinase [Chryseosolibacter sp.]
MKALTPLLLPFAILYDAVTSIRNRLYDAGVKPSVKFDVPVVGVGNLAVGGTGKTPMVEYLIRLLGTEYHIATLSRGYGRRSRGFRVATGKDDALTIGDEPLQLYRKFKDRVVVAVGEERAWAIPQILDRHPETDLILLDDAFQHRKVRPGFQILLTDYHKLFVSDYVLPAGRLRESRKGADRADAVVVTKCPPHITDDEMIAIESSIRRYTRKAVFFTGICYRNILPLTEASPYKPEKLMLLSGIANPKPLKEYLATNFALVRHFSFPDHHPYTAAELESICQAAAGAQAAVVTTEKDMARIDSQVFRARGVALYYLPVEIEFLKNGKEFDEMVLNAVRSYGK